ncbi:hypothetical protein Clacol_006083 [Clathrus columnatus]|uniref:HNH nuclease domain-containing protein n=1 Tax=Clathrus columnatus TaxID=1419009 RepID=A0AAV5AIR9_9AGAM|nr:hypothetical protein Clacol_006083 [Clathrus columnatus]
MESTTPLDHDHKSEQDLDVCFDEFSESIPSTSPSEKHWSQLIHHDLVLRMNRHVYKTDRRCLVENTVEENAVSYVLCLSRRLEPRRVDALEFAWGMQCGTLNLNTRMNVFSLSPNFKKYWERFKWFLLPEDDIIRRLYDAAINDREFPDIGEGPYNYHFVAHSDMKFVPIHRQTVFPDPKTEELKPDHFMFSTYPFENLGTLTCHLHPKFVVCRIGWMVAKADATFLSQYADAHPSLLQPITMILRICNKWTRLLDKKDSKHLSFFQNKIDPDDIISENWTRTGNGRVKPPRMSRKRPKKSQNGVKRKRKGSPPHFIPTKKLRMLEEQMSPSYVAEKTEDILSWKSVVSGEHDNQNQSNDTTDNNDGKTMDTTTEG